MSFELIISCIEETPSLIEESNNSYDIVFSIFDLMLYYSLDFDKNIDINSLDFLVDINNNFEEYFLEDEINFIISISERLFESIENTFYQKAFKNFISNYFNKSWKHQYIILNMIISYSEYNNDIDFFQQLFECFSELLNSSENKLRFVTLYCVKSFVIKYKKEFIDTYIYNIFPLIINLLNNENNIQCRYELLFCFKYIFRYTNNIILHNYIDSIISLLMNIFIEQNISCNLKKLVLINILEINKKRDDKNINLSLNKIDIIALLKYYINIFEKRQELNLYNILLETIILAGGFNEVQFNKILPDILNYIIKLFNLLEIIIKNNQQIISINEFSQVFKKIFPIITKNKIDFKFIIELIQILISLIKLEKNLYYESSNKNKNANNIFWNEYPDNNDDYAQSELNFEKGDLSSLLSILLNILNNVNNPNINSSLSLIENEILNLTDYSLDENSKKFLAEILSKIINLSSNKEMKTPIYVNILISMIEKEIEIKNVKKYFEKIKEIIEINNSEFLNKSQINSLFDKLYNFLIIIKSKRNQLSEKENIKEIKKNKEFKDENNISIQNDIEDFEDIQTEIIDIIGLMLKLHNDKCNYLLDQIITTIIPTFINSGNNLDIKLALCLCDDLILYLGQEQLIENIWDSLYEILTKYINKEDDSIRQVCAYGIGIFSQKTLNNFDKYSKGLIDSLYQSLSFSLKQKNEINEDNEDFFLALDNIIAANGKIIFYHYNDISIRENLNNLITNWLMNLPLKWDESEWINQHEWMVNLFLNKTELIPYNCYNHYFQSLAEIYKTKYSNDIIDKNIENIFINYVKKDEQLLNILSIIYDNASDYLKNKLSILAGQN